MSHPEGNCPICQKPFKDGDDIVICPSCGAPYHRECYKQKGACVFEDRHAAGFEYGAPAKPPAAEKPAPPTGTYTNGTPYANMGAAPQRTAQNSGGVLCPNCQTVNDSGNIFCDNCGYPLHGQAPAGNGAGAGGAGGGFFGQGAYSQQEGQAAGDMEGQINGIPKRDWALYIGNNAPSYLYRLSAMERGNRINFLFSAFFISPIYFAYRKMWGWAALALFSTMLFFMPQVLWIAADAGTPLWPGLSLSLLDTALSVASVLSFASQVLFGLFAVYFYRQSATKRMGLLQQRNENALDYQNALIRSGGVSVLGVIIVLVLLFAFVSVLYAVVGEPLLEYFYPGYFSAF